MKHLLLIAGFIGLCTANCISNTPFWQSIFPNVWQVQNSDITPPLRLNEASQSMMVMPPACIPADSTELVKLYNSLGINLLTNPMCQWNLFQPVSTWFGVTMDNDGYVVAVELLNSAAGCILTGVLPTDIGTDGFTKLRSLKLSINQLHGTIPPNIGLLQNLETLWLDDNQFSGAVPEELGDASKLSVIWLDNNNLTGAIPDNLKNLDFLRELIIFNNQFDSLPDFTISSITNFTQDDDIQVKDNAFTFDDLVPNADNLDGATYAPQDSFFTNSTVTLTTGSNYVIDLGIDADISDNQYQWYRNSVPFGPVLNVNKLDLSPIDFDDAGTYCCQVTNPRLPLLTLYSRCLTINVICGQSVEDRNDVICDNQTIVINGTTYGNPANGFPSSGTEDVPQPDQYGCDSIILVDLTVINSTPTDFTPTICPDDTVIVNGTPYHFGNDNGMETFNVGGCDSVVNVNLDFYALAEGTVNDMICRSDTVMVNGNSYHFNNASGNERLVGQAFRGCDSLVAINLSFHPVYEDSLILNLCNGNSVVYNGTTYNSSNLTGDETVTGVAPNGCDSLVHVRVNLSNGQTYLRDDQLCPGQTIEVNGNTYGDGHPLTGMETIPLPNGCDSIININLSVGTGITQNIAPFLCYDETIEVNGTVYGNPALSLPNSGLEIIPGTNGDCDTTINIFLNFHPEYRSDKNLVICQGETVVYNGTTYSSTDPGGTEFVAGVAPNGCDSVYNLTITEHIPTPADIFPVICEGEEFELNGQIFDAGRLQGTVILADAGFYGCDSTVNVDLTITPSPTDEKLIMLCPGTSELYNGTLYGSQNGGQDNGTETITTMTGCDTIVTVTVDYFTLTPGVYQEQICPTDTVFYNGNAYYQGNATGTENIGPLSYTGCDSTVNIQVTFFPQDTFQLNNTLCSGTTIEVNGTTYGEAPGFPESGIEILLGANMNGCDSIVEINLDFNSFVENNINEIICGCDTREFGGNTYDCNTPTDTITLAGQSYVGCDSIININLNYIEPPVTDLNLTFCADEDTIVNGVLYNITNPIGTETFNQITAQGCDSIVNINLTFIDEIIGDTITSTICQGDSLIVNGVTYHDAGIYNQLLENAAESGCDSTTVIELITTIPSPVVLDPLGQVCPSASPVALATNQSGINGNWSGTGVDANQFDPSELTADTYVLTFTPTDGCASLNTTAITIADYSSGNVTDSICAGESINIGSLTISVPGLYQDTILGTGGDCDSITIITITEKATTPIPLEALSGVCASDTPVSLNPIQNGLSGNWSGANVDENVFTPMDLSGPIELTFTPDDPGCFTENSTEIIVNEGGPVILEVFGDTCDLSDPIALNPVQNGIEGTWSGTNVDNNEFDPSGLNGNIDLTFTPNIISCVTSNTTSIMIEAATPVLLEPLGEICQNTTVALSTTTSDGVSGTWSGMGIDNGNEFTPTSLMSGIVSLTFTPEASECLTTNITTIIVNEPTSTDITESICDGLVTINGVEYNTPGTFTDVIPSGNFNGCDSTLNITITAENVPINLTPFSDICNSATPLVLSTIQDGISGTWSGDGITGNQFNPSLVDGEVELTFTANPGQCATFATTTINVLEGVTTTFDESICMDENFTINGVDYNTTGMHTELIPNGSFSGCDSTIILNLTVIDGSYTIDNFDPICTSATPLDLPPMQGNIPGSWEGDGVTGNSFNPTGLSGNITLNFIPNTGTCAQPATTTIEVSPAITETLEATICSDETYTINQVDYNETGTFTETIANGSFSGCDSIILLNLTVEQIDELPTPDAGIDQEICGEETTLSALPVTGATGSWSFAGATATLSDPLDSTAIAMDLTAAQYNLVWSLSTDICPDYAQDTMVINIAQSPVAVADSVDVLLDNPSVSLNILDNDLVNGNVNIEFLNSPNPGTLSDDGNGQITYTAPPGFLSTQTGFAYTICDELCPDICTEAEVIFNLLGSEDIMVPSGITPNNDGVNDVLIIPAIRDRPELYDNAELIIFNRWGDIIFQAKPYLNDWDGSGSNGKLLPEGTYYYALRLNLGEGKVYKGDVTILR